MSCRDIVMALQRGLESRFLAQDVGHPRGVLDFKCAIAHQ